MPSVRNLVIVADWTDPIPVPEPGALIVADATGPSDGAVNPAFQAVANRSLAVADGVVSLAAVTVDGIGQQSVSPTPGNIDASGTIAAGVNVRAQNNVAAITGNVSAGTYVDAAQDLRAHDNGDSSLDGAKLVWTNVGTGADEGNPPRTTPLLNDLRPVNTCKAWARFAGDGADPATFAFTDGINFLTAVPQTNRIVRFGFAEPMADDKFSATCNATDGLAPQNPAPIGWNASYVDIIFPVDVSGPGAVAVDGSLQIFGRQTS